jgi:c-di-GMP-binding flagellar brake protein YcgR
MVERRRFKRLPAGAEVTIRPARARRSARATSKNLSGGGILFASSEPLEVGAVVDIVVEPGQHPGFARSFQPLKARIRVVRVKGTSAPYEVAGEFLDVG